MSKGTCKGFQYKEKEAARGVCVLQLLWSKGPQTSCSMRKISNEDCS
ncbi:unnamed protein product [Calypogeia fissa]